MGKSTFDVDHCAELMGRVRASGRRSSQTRIIGTPISTGVFAEGEAEEASAVDANGTMAVKKGREGFRRSQHDHRIDKIVQAVVMCLLGERLVLCKFDGAVVEIEHKRLQEMDMVVSRLQTVRPLSGSERPDGGRLQSRCSRTRRRSSSVESKKQVVLS